jgi:uncharacterized membrane protein YccF (DUF307 family)
MHVTISKFYLCFNIQDYTFLAKGIQSITRNNVYLHVRHYIGIHIYMLMLLGAWIWIVRLWICITHMHNL